MNNKMGKQLYLFIKRNQAIYLLIIYKLAYFRVLRKKNIYIFYRGAYENIYDFFKPLSPRYGGETHFKRINFYLTHIVVYRGPTVSLMAMGLSPFK